MSSRDDSNSNESIRYSPLTETQTTYRSPTISRPSVDSFLTPLSDRLNPIGGTLPGRLRNHLASPHALGPYIANADQNTAHVSRPLMPTFGMTTPSPSFNRLSPISNLRRPDGASPLLFSPGFARKDPLSSSLRHSSLLSSSPHPSHLPPHPPLPVSSPLSLRGSLALAVSSSLSSRGMNLPPHMPGQFTSAEPSERRSFLDLPSYHGSSPSSYTSVTSSSTSNKRAAPHFQVNTSISAPSKPKKPRTSTSSSSTSNDGYNSPRSRKEPVVVETRSGRRVNAGLSTLGNAIVPISETVAPGELEATAYSSRKRKPKDPNAPPVLPKPKPKRPRGRPSLKDRPRRGPKPRAVREKMLAEAKAAGAASKKGPNDQETPAENIAEDEDDRNETAEGDEASSKGDSDGDQSPST